MTPYIPKKVRQQVIERAKYRCEYCLIPEQFLATYFHVDHVRSLKHGGNSDFDNLVYACPHCNQHKGSDVGTFADDDGEILIRFFNPRRDTWINHFEAVEGEIVAISAIGQATVTILNFNQPERLILRRELALLGLYPGI